MGGARETTLNLQVPPATYGFVRKWVPLNPLLHHHIPHSNGHIGVYDVHHVQKYPHVFTPSTRAFSLLYQGSFDATPP